MDPLSSTGSSPSPLWLCREYRERVADFPPKRGTRAGALDRSAGVRTTHGLRGLAVASLSGGTLVDGLRWSATCAMVALMSGAQDWDCIVVGGGAAGLSAALVLGRARRRVLVIDNGGQSNLPAHAIGGLLGNDGRSPRELYAQAVAELAVYPTVELREGMIATGSREEGRFVLATDGGETFEADRVLLATGMQYQLPDLPGIAELWGKDVFHCPYCHGWEVRDRALGVLGSENGVQRALLLRRWSPDVVLLTDGPAEFDDAGRGRLERAHVELIDRPVAGLRVDNGRLAAVLLDGGGELAREGLLVRAPLRPRSPLAGELGAAMTESGQVDVDEFGQTTVPGLYAAGDICLDVPQVSTAIGSGAVAGAMINDHLLAQAHGIDPSFPWRTQQVAAP